jgi:hypothetical protein
MAGSTGKISKCYAIAFSRQFSVFAHTCGFHPFANSYRFSAITDC